MVFVLKDLYLLIKFKQSVLGMLNINYITNASGNQIAVQIPINDWLRGIQLTETTYKIRFTKD